MFSMSMWIFDTSFVKIRLLVIDLKLNQFLHKESDLTLTFDPLTMKFVQFQALIDGNFMCEYDQNPCPRLSALRPIISPYFAYQAHYLYALRLEVARVNSDEFGCGYWFINGTKFHKSSCKDSFNFLRNHCHAVITVNGNKTCF